MKICVDLRSSLNQPNELYSVPREYLRIIAYKDIGKVQYHETVMLAALQYHSFLKIIINEFSKF